MVGFKVVCNNCGIKWVRITDLSNPGGTVAYADLQYTCPNCHSNDYRFQEPRRRKGKHDKISCKR